MLTALALLAIIQSPTNWVLISNDDRQATALLVAGLDTSEQIRQSVSASVSKAPQATNLLITTATLDCLAGTVSAAEILVVDLGGSTPDVHVPVDTAPRAITPGSADEMACRWTGLSENQTTFAYAEDFAQAVRRR